MDRTKVEKINRFLNDTIMSDAVYDVLLKSFLKTRAGDIYTKAASRLAIDFLDDAWKDLRRIKLTTADDKEDGANVGL